MVFDAFTSPNGQLAFYGQDDRGWIVRSETDVRVGGSWTILFGPSPGQLYRPQHVFRTIDRPRYLLLSTTETRLDGTTLKFETEFGFEAADEGTLMTMIQHGLPTDPRGFRAQGAGTTRDILFLDALSLRRPARATGLRAVIRRGLVRGR